MRGFLFFSQRLKYLHKHRIVFLLCVLCESNVTRLTRPVVKFFENECPYFIGSVAPLSAASPHFAALHSGLSAAIGFRLNRQCRELERC